MIRRALLPATLLLGSALLGACGGDDGLTVRGSAEVETATLRSGFQFANEIRLDGPGAEDNVRGSCSLNELAEDQYGIQVEIVRGFAAEPQGLASITIMHRNDGGDARVEAELGTDTYASVDGACGLAVDYVDDDGGVVGLSGTCDLATSDGATATALIGLDLAGCEVTELAD